MRIIVRSEDQIDEVLNATAEATDKGRTGWPGMTYEDGISAALTWLFGESDDNPVFDRQDTPTEVV